MSLFDQSQEFRFDPLRLAARPAAIKAVFVLAGTLILALASQIFAVTMIGALYGWRLGAATVLAWLAEAAMGFPVLAGGAGGLAPFAGPTAGYLASFPVIAALVGWLAAR